MNAVFAKPQISLFAVWRMLKWGLGRIACGEPAGMQAMCTLWGFQNVPQWLPWRPEAEPRPKAGQSSPIAQGDHACDDNGGVRELRHYVRRSLCGMAVDPTTC